mmetsp:Transcript_45183/g.72590  ORF Transcript_45183/g.72590 Transcript_45183/m.72590 type:complete len:273 (+) Transcript_45183:3095-3913(+)
MIELICELRRLLEELGTKAGERGEGIELRLASNELRKPSLQCKVLGESEVCLIEVYTALGRHKPVDAIRHPLLRLGDGNGLIHAHDYSLGGGKLGIIRVGLLLHVNESNLGGGCAADELDGDHAHVACFAQLYQRGVQAHLFSRERTECRLISQQHLAPQRLWDGHSMVSNSGSHLPQQIAGNSQLPLAIRHLRQHDVVLSGNGSQALVLGKEALCAMGDATQTLLACRRARARAQIPRHRRKPLYGRQRARLVGEVVVQIYVEAGDVFVRL